MTAPNDVGSTFIPDGWVEKPIRDLCHVWSGGTPTKTEARFWNGEIPWVSGKDLKSPQLDNSIDHISVEGLETGSRLAPAGAVFILVRGMGLAKDLPIAVANRPMAFNQDIKALVPRTDLPGSFLRSAIYHARERLLSRIVPSAHGTMTLNLDDVENLSIPVPADVAEAEVIASALTMAQQAASAEKRQLDATVELKHAAMRTLFTRGLKGRTHTETEIGLVPESWHVERLGAHHLVVSGGTPSRANSAYWQGGTIPWVKTTEVDYRVIYEAEEHITQTGLDSSAAKLLPVGTLLLAMYGQGVTRGKVALLGVEAACNQACAAIRPVDEAIRTDYLYYFLTYRYEAIRQLAHGGQQQNLNLDIVRDLLIAAPPDTAEQSDIVAILGAIDRKIDLHKRKRAVLDELFKTLLHKLMTGEIRVDQLDLSALSRSEEVAA